MNYYMTALKSLMGVAHDIPAIKAAVKWRYEDPMPRDISGGDHPRHSGTDTEWHQCQGWDLHIMSQTRAIHQLQTEPGCDRSPPGHLRKGWKLMKTNPPTTSSPLLSIAHYRHKYHFLSLLSRSILPTFEINTIQGERKYSAACLYRTPDHDNNMDWEETQDGFMHHQQKTEHFRPSHLSTEIWELGLILKLN